MCLHTGLCGGEAAGSGREDDFDLTGFSRAINSSGGVNIPRVYCELVANRNQECRGIRLAAVGSVEKLLHSMEVLSLPMSLILISRMLSAFPKQSQWHGLGGGG